MPQMGPLMWFPLYLTVFLLLSIMISVLTSFHFSTTTLAKETLTPKQNNYCSTQWMW